MSAPLGFRDAGFFVLRTPLLPFAELLQLSVQAESARGACPEPASATDAQLTAGREAARQALRAVVARPLVRAALQVASPSLLEAADAAKDALSERAQKTDRGLVRYLARMAGRATPFGLFAGISVGEVSPATETRLQRAALGEGRRRTRLDAGLLSQVAATLSNRPDLRGRLPLQPNSSVCHAYGRVQVAEAHDRAGGRSYQLSSAEASEPLLCALRLAQEGLCARELARRLAEELEVSQPESEAFVDELLAAQLVQPAIGLRLTGHAPVEGLLSPLREAGAEAELALLQSALDALAQADRCGLVGRPEAEASAAQALAALGCAAPPGRTLQVDWVHPAPEAQLGRPVTQELARAAQLLQTLCGPSPSGDSLTRFAERFAARYEGREVPLAEALDEESGLGFEPPSEVAAEGAVLLQGIPLEPPHQEPTAPAGARHEALLGLLCRALQQGVTEVELTEQDLQALSASRPLPLPDTFAVAATLSAKGEAALAEGRFQILIEGVYASAAMLLGRFAGADPALEQRLAQLLAAEERLRPEAVFAEIVHLPAGRVGNVVARPRLRQHEIHYLGFGSATGEDVIPISDLMLSLAPDGRFLLRSRRLGREVLPRLSNAHNFPDRRGLSLYRFLAELQRQGTAPGMLFGWGALEPAPFLPRVRCGRLILSLAQWRLSKLELAALAEGGGSARYRALQRLRAARGLPRWVTLKEGDNDLPVDLEEPLSAESALHLLTQGSSAVLTELFPAPDALCAGSPEGALVHELVVPFLRDQRAVPPTPARPEAPLSPALPRRLPPGSDWLYAKLYLGPASLDRALLAQVAPLVARLRHEKLVSRWFYVRYGDPERHLRLRFQGDPAVLRGRVLPLLHEAFAPLLDCGQAHRLSFDTYEREVERYGGPRGIEPCEALFEVDSQAALELLAELASASALAERGTAALLGMNAWLNGFGLDLTARAQLMVRLRNGFGREQGAGAQAERELGAQFRRDRAALSALLGGDTPQSGPWPGVQRALARLQERAAPHLRVLSQLAAAGALTVNREQLAEHLLHMHANRLLRAAQRPQELVLYDRLARHYTSELARAGRALPSEVLQRAGGGRR